MAARACTSRVPRPSLTNWEMKALGSGCPRLTAVLASP